MRFIAQGLPPILLTVASVAFPLDALAEEYDFTIGSIEITPAMVIIKWGVQIGLAQIPRSTNRRRLLENLLASSSAMPELSAENVALLSNLHLLTSTPLCVAV